MPNLGTRANQYLGYLVDRYLFGVRKSKPFIAKPIEKGFFLLYAPAAFVYRMMVMLTIALYVATQFFFVGVLLALWAFILSVGKPVYSGLKHVLTAPALHQQRKRATAITFSAISTGLSGLLMLPVPLHTETEGVVWRPQSSEVVAKTQGFIQHYAVVTGQSVKPGDMLFHLVDQALEARIKLLQWKVREHQLELRRYLAKDPSKSTIAQIELERARAELTRETERLSQLDVRSSRAGFFTPTKPLRDSIGRYVAQGQVLGYVLPGQPETVRLVVEQHNIDLVKGSTKTVELMLVSDSRRTGTTQIIRAVPAGRYDLPSPALSQQGGGMFAVDPKDPEGKTTLSRLFQFDASLPEALKGAPFGSRVLVRFEHQPEPLGFQLYRRVRQLFLSQFDA